MKTLIEYIKESCNCQSAECMNKKCKGKEMHDYNNKKLKFIEAIDASSDDIDINDFLKRYDSTGAMKDSLDNGDVKDDDILVAVKDNSGNTYAYVYGDNGASF